jgi:hypothetical protein
MMYEYKLEDFKLGNADASHYDRKSVFSWLVGGQITFWEFDNYISSVHQIGYEKGHDAGYDECSQNMESM